MALHPVTDEERKNCDPKHKSPRWTICELLRRIYLLAEVRADKETMRLVLDSLCYAKRMNDKLSQTNPRYAEGWYDKRERKIY